ncbi:helix-hairpin-helix domain-containing protein [Candidatus Dojkabacteria bacterium]|nr:helix-hairpin-helix domain-containing protein [Candidatus Dojkabacteria bacterium]
MNENILNFDYKLFFKDKKHQIYVVVGIILVILVLGYVFFNKNGKNISPSPLYTDGSYSDEEKLQENGDIEQQSSDCDLWVDISGSVILPDVYCLKSGSIVNDIISLSEGFSDDVCIEWVDKNLNRAELLQPNQKIYIPSLTDSDCILLNREVQSLDGDLNNGVISNSSGLCSDGRISINTADSSQLESITGVGPATATKIIEARPYNRIEDIMDVKGIGESTFEKMKDQICL